MAVTTANAMKVGFLATALLTAVICVGCGGSAPSKETPQSSPAPQNIAQAAQQAAESLKQLSQNQTATPVDFDKLVALMPEMSGWTRSEPKGQQVSMGVSLSRAQADYEKGESSIHLEITDTSFNQALLAPMSMMMMANYSERSSKGYKKGATVNGSPGFETWDSESKDAEVTAVVANRIIVTAKGQGVASVDPVRALVQAVDFTKLAALK